jgi:hypothetical protein
MKIRKANPDTQSSSKFKPFNPGNKAKTVEVKPGAESRKFDRKRMEAAIKKDEKDRS